MMTHILVIVLNYLNNKQNNFMTKYIHLIYSSILFFLIVFVCIEYHNNNVLESRINSLNKKSIDFRCEKTFKEDYYITQQSNDTNLLLVVFPFLLALASVFTYTNILEKHKIRIEEIVNDNKKQKRENDSYHKKFILLESELNFQTGLIYSERASKNITIDIGATIVQSLSAMEKFASCIISENYINKEPATKSLNNELDFLSKIIQNDIFHIKIDFSIYKERNERISKVLIKTQMEKFNKIVNNIRIIET